MLLHSSFEFGSGLVPTLIEVVPILDQQQSGRWITATVFTIAGSASRMLNHGISVPAV